MKMRREPVVKTTKLRKRRRLVEWTSITPTLLGWTSMISTMIFIMLLLLIETPINKWISVYIGPIPDSEINKPISNLPPNKEPINGGKERINGGWELGKEPSTITNQDDVTPTSNVPKTNVKDSDSDSDLVVIAIISLTTSITSLIGLLSTMILAWRKEGRESAAAELELQKKKLELEQMQRDLSKH